MPPINLLAAAAGPSRLGAFASPMRSVRAAGVHRAVSAASRSVSSSRKREAAESSPVPTMAHGHSAFEHLATTLSRTQPCFGAKGDSMEILESPTAFHDRLLDMIRNARRRIFISTLYIGTEEESLVDATRTALKATPGLRATFMLDYNRATRAGRGPGPKSTVDMLLPLQEEFGDRVDVWLYRTPKLRGLLEKIIPPRYNEGWGTWHAKYYAVDDDVVLSGANLAASYFTNRQDRYIHIHGHPSLLSYLSSITRLISDYSYKVSAHVRPGLLGAHGVSLDASTSKPGAGALWRERSLHPRGWAPHAQATLSAFQQAWRASNGVRTRDARDDGADTWFWPVVQAGPLGIREEERTLGDVWAAIAKAGEGAVDVELTSGYFGLYKAYKKAVIASPAPFNLIAASPKANGFYGSKGISRLIPEGYTLLERRFYADVAANDRLWTGPGSGGVRLQEWERKGWTYHAKGIWLSPPREDPFFTFIGSSNLSTRSLTLDTELSLLLATSSESLRSQLGREVAQLREHAHDVGAETWKLEERKVSFMAKLLVALGVEGML